MDQQQLQALVQEVAGMLQQGVSPEEIAQSLVQQGIPEDIVGQIIDAAAQGMQGGQGQPQGGEQGGSVLEALAQQDPEMLAAIIQEWESMAPEQGMAPQGQPSGLFG